MKASMSSYKISVLFPSPLESFDYVSSEKIPEGSFVLVPFGRTLKRGVVWPFPSKKSSFSKALKSVQEVLPLPLLPLSLLKFIKWVAQYTSSPTGAVLALCLSPSSDFFKKSKKPLSFEKPLSTFQSICFSEEQKEVLKGLLPASDKGFQVSLLEGVTGSGKTEVYFEVMAQALEKNKQILVLLPEINLTTQWKERFKKRFGVEAAYYHSNMTPKQRRDTFQSVMSGEIKVLVGARSALFLPFSSLGLIVVDEEHDSSYKQEDGVCYQARDMAVLRAKIEDIPILLSTATPSLESFYNVKQGKYLHFKMPSRYAQAELPDIQLIDMKKNKTPSGKWISEALKKEIDLHLQKKEQTLLFLNRRGYAPVVLCKECGEKLECPHCSSCLVEHQYKTGKKLICHQCGWSMSKPLSCPHCGAEDSFVSCGSGVERIEEEVKELFPKAITKVITSDTISSEKDFEKMISSLSNGQIDILIGTQILAKGHHFPNLTLVGIIDADLGLLGSDLRSSERTFQLLSQVTGRAGREKKKGKALLQTYYPENSVFKLMIEQNQKEFLKEELSSRQILDMPPFSKLVGLILSAKNKNTLLSFVKELSCHQPFLKNIEIYGPAPAPLFLLRQNYRYRFLIKVPKSYPIENLITSWFPKKMPSSIRVKIDVDPYSFL
ncbi:MAG: primosomal protein N' [Alphaproteobacteria bacterium]|nr:primosomal protein N' [Alphaproteobacteria bacterium]